MGYLLPQWVGWSRERSSGASAGPHRQRRSAAATSGLVLPPRSPTPNTGPAEEHCTLKPVHVEHKNAVLGPHRTV